MNRKRSDRFRRAFVMAAVLLAFGVAMGYWMSGYADRGLPTAAVEADKPQDHAAHEDAMTDMDHAAGMDMTDEHGGSMDKDMEMDMEMETGTSAADSAAAESDSHAADGTEWTWPAGVPQAGETGTLRITVTVPGGKPDAGLQLNHEKKLHLILVSQGLSTFMHLHPAETSERGVFEVPVTFPSAGRYKLVADFKPQNGEQQWQSTWVQAGGNGQRHSEPVLAADKELTHEADGMKVRLSFDKAPTAGQAAELTFTFTDRASGKPVRDLQPYLGAAGHVVIMDAGAEDYLHVHAMSNPDDEAAKFHATFPERGLYKIWGQFQRNGRVVTVPFVVKVD